MFFCKHNKLPLLCDLLEDSAEVFFSISELVKWWGSLEYNENGLDFCGKGKPKPKTNEIDIEAHM